MSDSRINQIQQILKERQIDATLILSADAHSSEYLPDYYKVRAKLSGFSGSAGTLIIAQEAAWLLTDGRYFLQASKQLEGSGIELIKHNDFARFLKEHFYGKKIAINYSCTNTQIYENLKQFLNIEEDDFSLQIAQTSELSFNEIYKCKYIDKNSSQKLSELKKDLEKISANYNAHVISSLDDIAYICNLRGSDVACNPVFLSYFILRANKAELFCRSEKLSQEARDYLHSQNITIREYEEIFTACADLDGEVICEFDKTAIKLTQNLKQVKNAINPSSFAKSKKTPGQIANIKRAHIDDGAALVRFYRQLEKLILESTNLCEADIDKMLKNERAKHPDYIGDSFATIAGFGPNSALPHYRAPLQNSSQLQPGGVLLIDSGAQYQHGTTDITRVIIIPGKDAPEGFKKDYTMVLKAHIAMASLVHKAGVAMPLLDVMARSVMWAQGMDYIHGTGHGVGDFLNVHEGPQVLSYFAPVLEKSAVQAGMLTSIEPGIYHANKYGIRLENLYFSEHKLSSEYGEFLEFVPATMFPFERELIDIDELDNAELKWLNDYHAQVLEKLSPILDYDEQKWLEQKCQKITRI